MLSQLYASMGSNPTCVGCHRDRSDVYRELAEIASLSPFYFQRLFTRLVGMPVGEYVRLRRLARSCEALTDTQMHVLDIALQFGFSDHANYTRAFRVAYGLTPQEYRQHPVHPNQYIKADVSLRYAEHEEVPGEELLTTIGVVIR